MQVHNGLCSKLAYHIKPGCEHRQVSLIEGSVGFEHERLIHRNPEMIETEINQFLDFGSDGAVHRPQSASRLKPVTEIDAGVDVEWSGSGGGHGV